MPLGSSTFSFNAPQACNCSTGLKHMILLPEIEADSKVLLPECVEEKASSKRNRPRRMSTLAVAAPLVSEWKQGKCSLDIWKLSMSPLLSLASAKLSLTLSPKPQMPTSLLISGYAAAAAAAAKSLQSCLTLCDPIDDSPPSSAVPGILQARTLEWVAISLSNAWKWKVKVNSLSRVQLLETPWTAAYQALPSMGFSRQEYWSALPLPSPI